MKNIKLDKQVKQYLIDCIDSGAYNIELRTDNEKIMFVYECFCGEYGYNVARMSETNAFMSWLQGLPTCINIDFYNNDILDLAEKWGSLETDASEAKQWKIIDNWFNLLAVKFMQLKRKAENGASK